VATHRLSKSLYKTPLVVLIFQIWLLLLL